MSIQLAPAPQRIIARFGSRCPNCRQFIAPGEAILYQRGYPVTHADACSPAPAPEPVRRIPVDSVGVYVLPDGAICKVQPNADRTRTYAKRWVEIPGQRLNQNDARVRGEYRYEQGLVAEVARSGQRMDLAQAKAFILRYGVCARCGRVLKAADSVERGIGPICIQYFGGAL